MSHIHKHILLSVVALAAMSIIASCTGNSSDREKEIFNEITGHKFLMPQYITFDAKLGTSHYLNLKEYFAFNSDSTVDNWMDYRYYTGTFSIEGNLVTCLFTDTIHNTDIIIRDGQPNRKYIFRYKDGLLYNYREYRRLKDGKWESILENWKAKRHCSNAGSYINDKFNVRYNGGFNRAPYDTTVDGMTVVRRFNYRIETTYQNGKRHGVYKEFYNGNLTTFGSYADGEPTGRWYTFNEDGELDFEFFNIRASDNKKYKYMTDGICHVITRYRRDSAPVDTWYFNDINGRMDVLDDDVEDIDEILLNDSLVEEHPIDYL